MIPRPIGMNIGPTNYWSPSIYSDLMLTAQGPTPQWAGKGSIDPR